jgi:hypothetical protein
MPRKTKRINLIVKNQSKLIRRFLSDRVELNQVIQSLISDKFILIAQLHSYYLAYRILMDELDNLKSNLSKCDCKKW